MCFFVVILLKWVLQPKNRLVLTKLEARLDTLANGMMALQKWVPILINQNRKLIKGKPATLNASPSPVSLSIKSSSDPGQVDTSSDDSTASELDLRGDQLKTERNTTRELYYDMQMHLVNMLVVPKSHTSLFLNQRKDLMSQLGGGHGHWRHQYTDEDWKRDRVGNLLAAIKACIMEISIGLSDAPFVGPNDRAPNPKIHWVRAAMSPNDQREQHL